jgi:tetratricopeptide (TPR) repeat protein
MQKTFGILLSLICLVALAACGAKKKELSQLEQAQINNHYETARRELFIKNYAAAEQALAAIVKIDDSRAPVWLDLGVLRARLQKKSEARDAYKKALSTSEAIFAKEPQNQVMLITRLQSLILLGRTLDARDVMTKVARQNPGNAAYQELEKQKVVDVLLADPQIRDAVVP